MDGAGTNDVAFVGSIPELYDRYMVPMFFEPYAIDLVGRVAERFAPTRGGRLLEVAAGTGAVTRLLASDLADTVRITATDLNQAMLDQAATVGTTRPVTWRLADVMSLPFDDDAFDAVVIQFGVMFFPDKVAAIAEIRRVLRPGGLLAFNVWESLASNDFTRTANEALAALYPDDPPSFMERVPHGYGDEQRIRDDLLAGGFTIPATFERVVCVSRAANARIPAMGLCHGTPIRNEILHRDPDGLASATDRVSEAIERAYGSAGLEAIISALVVLVESP